MSKLDVALEEALRAIAEGKGMEEALSRSPEHQAKLLPILRAALLAREAGSREMPPGMRMRLRSQFLQRAASMREMSSAQRTRMIPALPRLAITLGMVAALVLTSTGLVRAASGSLPGDQLYRVKRSWEGFRLLLTAQSQQQYMLKSEFEQERLDEIHELLARGRLAPISFYGLVTGWRDGEWLISGVPVAITAATVLPTGEVGEGLPVLITGHTRSDGAVVAESIELLQPGVALPPLRPSNEADEEAESEGEPAPMVPNAQFPTPGAIPASFEFTGIVEALGTSVWRVNGQAVDVSGASIFGSVKVGSEIRFEGYYGADGRFLATRIEVTQNLTHEEGKEQKDSAGGSGGSDSVDDSENEHEDDTSEN